jgi:hypothetical protein
MYYMGESYKTIEVYLYPENDDLWDDVNTLKAVTDIIKMYVYYRNGTLAEQFSVRIDPNVTLNYSRGVKDASDMIKLMFYETTSGNITAIRPNRVFIGAP